MGSADDDLPNQREQRNNQGAGQGEPDSSGHDLDAVAGRGGGSVFGGINADIGKSRHKHNDGIDDLHSHAYLSIQRHSFKTRAAGSVKEYRNPYAFVYICIKKGLKQWGQGGIRQG